MKALFESTGWNANTTGDRAICLNLHFGHAPWTGVVTNEMTPDEARQLAQTLIDFAASLEPQGRVPEGTTNRPL